MGSSFQREKNFATSCVALLIIRLNIQRENFGTDGGKGLRERIHLQPHTQCALLLDYGFLSVPVF